LVVLVVKPVVQHLYCRVPGSYVGVGQCPVGLY